VSDTDVAGRLIGAAEEKAQELGFAVSVAVVDSAGVLKAFHRMDGAPLVSVESCQRKAYTAAAVGVPTQGLYDAYHENPVMLSQISTLSGILVIGGGIPVDAAGFAGAVGVAGGSAEQDALVAAAAAGAIDA